MGQILFDFYLKAGEIGGVNARTRLSGLTMIPSMQAKTLDDSPANIAKFEKAMETIKAEFGAASSVTSAVANSEMSQGQTIDFLRKQISTFSDLVSSRDLFQNDLKKSFERITETLTEAINVKRASIWLYNEEKTLIECADLFESDKSTHSAGVKLYSKDFPQYFNTIKSEKTLAAHDAHTDAGTREFSEVYLKPLGINSMLDTPIWINGNMVGVLCHEHVGPARKWTSDEENFAYLAGNITAMIIERNN